MYRFIALRRKKDALLFLEQFEVFVIELLGWIGQTLFALCAIPQAFKAYKDGHSRGISWGFLIMWYVAEILSFFYVGIKSEWGMFPLLVNYIGNFALLTVIIKYKIGERK